MPTNERIPFVILSSSQNMNRRECELMIDTVDDVGNVIPEMSPDEIDDQADNHEGSKTWVSEAELEIEHNGNTTTSTASVSSIQDGDIEYMLEGGDKHTPKVWANVIGALDLAANIPYGYAIDHTITGQHGCRNRVHKEVDFDNGGNPIGTIEHDYALKIHIDWSSNNGNDPLDNQVKAIAGFEHKKLYVTRDHANGRWRIQTSGMVHPDVNEDYYVDDTPGVKTLTVERFGSVGLAVTTNVSMTSSINLGVSPGAPFNLRHFEGKASTDISEAPQTQEQELTVYASSEVTANRYL